MFALMEATLTKKDAFLSGLQPANSASAAEARQHLEHIDLPTRKTEDWKYTRVAKLFNIDWKTESANQNVLKYNIKELDAYRIYISNGTLLEDISDLGHKDGIEISALTGDEPELQQLAAKEHLFAQINAGYTHNGIVVRIAKNVQIDQPIEIIQLTNGEHTLQQTRKLIVAEQSSSIHIVDAFYSEDTHFGWTNNVTEIIVKENANVHYDKLQYESNLQWHINSEYVHQESNSTFTINTITLNGGLVRNGLNIVVDGQNCETNLNGLYLLKGKQHVDNHTLVDHKKPNCTSNELYKGMVDDEATGVFNGKVFVREDAQKIEAFQQNNNIVMTDRATMNSKPELEIYADDVKCSHGSTTGQLDEAAIFYLQARGIGADKARKLLVAAFAGDVLSHVKNQAIRQHIDQMLYEQFGWEF